MVKTIIKTQAKQTESKGKKRAVTKSKEIEQEKIQIDTKQERQEQPIEEVEEEDESSSSDQDEDGELINNKLESKFLTVIARLREKDPKLYQDKTQLFNEEDFQNDHNMDIEESTDKKSKEKKYTYKDMEREKILQEIESKQKNSKKYNLQKNKNDKGEKTELTPFEEQQLLKSEFIKAAKTIQTEEIQEEDLFKVKEKKPQKKKKKNIEQENFNELLKSTDPEGASILKGFWGNNTKLDDTDLFLKKYILNKGWIDKSDVKNENNQIDKEDQQRSQEVDEFQAKYNFRFEQPDGTNLQTFPRNIQQSLRLKKESRKQKRKRKQQQKKQQLKKELLEIQKMKSLKKDEIVHTLEQINKKEKLQKIEIQDQQAQQNQGNDDNYVWYYCDDCEKGIPEEAEYYVCSTCPDYTLCKQCYDLIIHNHQMIQKVVEIGNGAPDEQTVRKTLASLLKCKKCKKMIDEFSKYYNYFPNKDSEQSYFYCQQCHDILPLSLKKKCKQIKQQKAKLNDLLQKDPEKIKQYVQDEYVDKLIEEYVNMDFKDKNGENIKTKFKYISVKPESFGLSDQQLLFSDDRELNNYVSIKKIVPYYQQNIRLRNSIYDKKIKTINKSARENQKKVEQMSDFIKKKKFNQLKERAQKRREKSKQKLRILDLSTKESQVNHFVPKSRLQSYGI